MTYRPMHVYNLRPSIPDHRDYRLWPALARLPDDALLPYIPATKDQGQEGACTGFALSSARAVVHAGAHGDAGVPVFSPKFIYREERDMEGTSTEDSGANIRDGLEVLRKLGVCLESDFPYRAGDFRDPVPDDLLAKAAPYAIREYRAVAGVDGVRTALAAMQPVVLGIAVHPSFEAVGADGRVPMPGPSEGPLGGHAILAIGYDRDPTAAGGGYVHLLNSWGPQAGDHGMYHLPYAYVDSAQYCFDAWTLA